MSKPKHTDGPARVDGQNIIAHEAEIGIANVYGNIGQPREGNASLLCASYNAFDSAAKKLGVNAVELAERMADCGVAELAEALTDILSRFRSCIAQGNGQIEGDEEAMAKAEAALAKVRGAS